MATRAARSPSDLSPTMLAVLRACVAEYDRAVTFERQRWGEESARRVAEKGIDPCLLLSPAKGTYKTLWSLSDRGMLTVKATPHESRERLRKGSWGHRIGGTEQMRQIVAAKHAIEIANAPMAMLRVAERKPIRILKP